MARWEDLQAAVTARYQRLSLPGWPDPHPDGAEARDEEYSRLTDPERYAIVHARARVWAEVLTDMLGAESKALDARESSAFDRGIEIAPPQSKAAGLGDDGGGLALLLLEQDGPPASLHLAVARPEIVLLTVPDCGCDACDRGSDDLLEAIDETVGMVVAQELVVLRGRGWYGHWSAGGSCQAHNTDLDWVMDVGRRLSDGEDLRLAHGTEALVGGPWI